MPTTKEYGSKLTLKDNFTSVIEKAIKATEQLRSKLQTTEKALNAMVNKKVKIGAQLDASVNTTINRLNGQIPKDRTIRIKARDEVTRTVTNIQRDIFKMTREIGMGMKDPFSGLNRSALNAARNISMIRTAASSILARGLTGGVMRGVVAGSAGSLLPSILGSAVAGRVAGGMAGRSASSVVPFMAGNMLANRMMTGQRVARRSGAFGPSSYTGDPDFHDSNERFQRLGRGDAPARFNRGSSSLTHFNADRADMIERQQKVMKERYGKSNYLSRFSATDEHIGDGDHLRVLNERLGPKRFAYQSAKEKASDMANSAKGKVQTVSVRVKAMTGSATSTIRSWGTSIGNSKIGEIGMRVKFAGERGLSSIQGTISRVSSAFGRIGTASRSASAVTSSSTASMTFDLQRFASGAGSAGSATTGAMARIRSALSSIGSAASGGLARARSAITNLASSARSLAGKSFSFTVKAITSGAMSAINALKSAIKGLSVAGAAVVIGGATMGLKGAMEMEQNVISIEHFVKYANTKQVSEGKGSQMSDADIKKASGDYMSGMRKYADDTSFSTGDVMNAGRRAVNVMSGDLAQADDLVKIAGDMAALNPGKTIMDAMEALADMKTGEMERMKEFGLKISADQFKGLVDKKGGDDLTEDESAKAYKMVMDQKLRTMFGGGAKKMGETATGKLSTLLGSGGSAMADIGTMFLPGIKTGLDKAIALIGGAGPNMIAAFKPMADGFNSFISGDGGGTSKFVAMFQQITTSVQPAIQAFSNFFSKVDFMKYFTNVATAVGLAIKLAMEILAPVFNIIGIVIVDVFTFMSAHAVDFQNVIKDLSKIWASSWPVLSDILLGAWNVIKPAMESLWNIAMVIVDVFTLAWPLIAGTIQVLWAVISPIFSGISLLLEGIAWAAGKAHSALQWVIDKRNQLSNSADINLNTNVNTNDGSDGSSERAVGMEYIPYNGYKVSAHRGEAILTRTEADNWRAGGSGGGGGVTININHPVVRDDSDLDRLGTMIANKLSEVRGNMGGTPATA